MGSVMGAAVTGATTDEALEAHAQSVRVPVEFRPFVDHRELRQRMGERARTTILEHYDLEALVGQEIDLLTRAV